VPKSIRPQKLTAHCNCNLPTCKPANPQAIMIVTKVISLLSIVAFTYGAVEIDTSTSIREITGERGLDVFNEAHNNFEEDVAERVGKDTDFSAVVVHPKAKITKEIQAIVAQGQDVVENHMTGILKQYSHSDDFAFNLLPTLSPEEQLRMIPQLVAVHPGGLLTGDTCNRVLNGSPFALGRFWPDIPEEGYGSPETRIKLRDQYLPYCQACANKTLCSPNRL